MFEAIHLQLLLATFSAWVGRQQAAVIVYLIEENRVLKEQLEHVMWDCWTGAGTAIERWRNLVSGSALQQETKLSPVQSSEVPRRVNA